MFFQMCLLRSTIAYLYPNRINSDVDFSENYKFLNFAQCILYTVHIAMYTVFKLLVC